MGATTSAAIVGLGITEMGRIYGRSTADFAADAVTRALADAGLERSELDGLLTNSGLSAGLGLSLQRELGLPNLKLLSEIQGYGSSAGGMVSIAAMAVSSGMVDAVACVFADTPLKEGRGAGAAYDASGPSVPTGFGAMTAAVGLAGANPYYALAARRHMETYGTTSEQFGAIAVAARQWAAMNPLAQMRDPITLADHQASRMIADPLHLLDCCLVSNGAIAVIVTSAERAAGLRPAAGPRARLGAVPPGLHDGEGQRLRAGHRRGPLGAGRAEDGRRHPGRRRRGRDLRLLHVHDAGVTGGLRLLRQG